MHQMWVKLMDQCQNINVVIDEDFNNKQYFNGFIEFLAECILDHKNELIGKVTEHSESTDQ